ncbi:unnamed protein product [Chilo suppressalis]|uniref:Uncharacterized protein n=1 Tax=Chilo suppressalis TaxID=168631 RepID=A0ABN8L6M1_CHISP|nr:unnamed protein product [Chilo suppressalis]
MKKLWDTCLDVTMNLPLQSSSVSEIYLISSQLELDTIEHVFLMYIMHYLMENKKGRPTGDKVDEAMEGIYSFLKENSEECQFSISELMNQINGDFVPHIRTVKNFILIIEKQKRDCVVCFRNTGFKILSDKWYEEKKKDYHEERLRVIREAAAIIREDIRGVVYDKNNYPLSDEFVKDVEAAVPESLQVFLTTMITKDKRGALEQWKKKCTAIAHSIITAVRPRSFFSPLQLGVGTFLYKKFGSKSLINILSAMGFCAPYREITIFENSCIHRAESEILENSFSQFVFDNADFNINTLDGHGTFHAMGGIHCVTPYTSIQREKKIPRIVEIKSASVVAQLGMVPVLSYNKHKSAGLQAITVADVEALRQLPSEILPTIPDLIWLYGKWSCSVGIPGWNGFMESVTANVPYERSKVICLPFINAPPSDYDTILTSLLEAVENSKRCSQKTTFITFDQPLYWKARDIVGAADPTSDLKNVVVRLGGFHLLVSFMGSIGMIMSGSGVEELFKLIYAENCVEKILAGHAYARAVRAAKLWVQYHRMVSLVKNFLEAERSGNWELHLDTIQKMLPFFHASVHFLYAKSAHLYLQDMRALSEKIPIEDYVKFTRRGCFTIRRSEKFWSGIMSDMTIEQTLMRSMKTTGGLTQGRGITDSTIASWTLGMVQLQNICEQIENFSGVSCSTTEQHVDMRPSRISRDNCDVEKLDMWLAGHNPFPENKELMSIGTGVIANENINCHRAYEIGREMMNKIIGVDFGSLSFRRKDKVLSLSTVNTSITIDESPVPIDPLLLFQRMCITKNSETDLKIFLAYELAPFPLSLFTEEGMRKGTKSLLYNAFEPLTENFQTGD